MAPSVLTIRYGIFMANKVSLSPKLKSSTNCFNQNTSNKGEILLGLGQKKVRSKVPGHFEWPDRSLERQKCQYKVMNKSDTIQGRVSVSAQSYVRHWTLSRGISKKIQFPKD